MKAIAVKSSKLEEFTMMDMNQPDINEDEFLLNVKAMGLGVHDGYFFPQEIKYPYIIGIEAAGVIDKVGTDIKDYHKGDRVAVVSMMQAKGGVWAEYAAISKDALIINIPKEMTYEEAAAVLVAGNTALKALKALDLQKGDHLFIAGGSGAIGTFVIQLAIEQGIIVSASSSKENENYMKELGANYTVSYRDPLWLEKINKKIPTKHDAAMAIPVNTSLESMETVKNSGKTISISNDSIPEQNRVEVIEIPYHLDVKKELQDLMQRIASREFHLEIEKVYRFNEAIEALKSKAKPHARGKSVITMKELKND